MTRSVLEKEIDELIASGVRLRFSGRVFEQEHTPGKGKTYTLQAVMLRVRAGRGAVHTELGDRSNEIIVGRAPRRGEAAVQSV